MVTWILAKQSALSSLSVQDLPTSIANAVQQLNNQWDRYMINSMGMDYDATAAAAFDSL